MFARPRTLRGRNERRFLRDVLQRSTVEQLPPGQRSKLGVLVFLLWYVLQHCIRHDDLGGTVDTDICMRLISIKQYTVSLR